MKKTGRPRKFEAEAALAKAVDVFHEKGYEATTLEDLTQAMGIQRPSLYSSFGNKEELFLSVLSQYSLSNTRGAEALLNEEPDGEKAIASFLQKAAEYLIASDGLGCLIVNTSVTCHPIQKNICDRIAHIHNQNEAMIYRRLKQALADGDLSSATDIRGLAQFYNGVIQGMAVLARGQKNPDAIRQTAKIAAAAWPG